MSPGIGATGADVVFDLQLPEAAARVALGAAIELRRRLGDAVVEYRALVRRGSVGLHVALQERGLLLEDALLLRRRTHIGYGTCVGSECQERNQRCGTQ